MHRRPPRSTRTYTLCPSTTPFRSEIDALLHGVDSGKVDTTPVPAAPGEARSFDFTSQDRIVRGRMPTLEMVNERFARLFRIRSEEHTSELQSLMRNSYAVFCLKQKKKQTANSNT